MGKENRKVIIGIISKHIHTTQVRTNSLIRDELKQAIIDNGAIPIGLFAVNDEVQYNAKEWKSALKEEDKEKIIEQIKLCDGIILQGGLTNETIEPFVANYCYENDIPCLGICAGQNCIAYALGGSICKISNPEKHNKSFEKYVHKIDINPTSKFYEIVGQESMLVNSRHKNTIKKCPKLDKVGICEDGYIDVIESKSRKFYIGVRFHPESLYKTDECMNNIFKYFIDACKK